MDCICQKYVLLDKPGVIIKLIWTYEPELWHCGEYITFYIHFLVKFGKHQKTILFVYLYIICLYMPIYMPRKISRPYSTLYEASCDSRPAPHWQMGFLCLVSLPAYQVLRQDAVETRSRHLKTLPF